MVPTFTSPLANSPLRFGRLLDAYLFQNYNGDPWKVWQLDKDVWRIQMSHGKDVRHRAMDGPQGMIYATYEHPLDLPSYDDLVELAQAGNEAVTENGGKLKPATHIDVRKNPFGVIDYEGFKSRNQKRREQAGLLDDRRLRLPIEA